ncbi:MAG: hypothetical protein H9W83_12290 [Leuconostoc sp.]|nr:hypothetical protein [Leuconostoc sp.]
MLKVHQDYSLRARDHNVKKAKLRSLKQKVLEKNPDEFYFGMMSKSGPSTSGKSATGTLNGDRGNKALSQEAVRLFKTQDLGYVRTMRNKTAKEVEALKRKVVGIEADGLRTRFVDDEEERDEVVEMEIEREAAEEEKEEEETRKRLAKLREKERMKAEHLLEAAEKRLEALIEAEEALDLTRKKMAKTTSVGGVNKNGVKFKIRERKK